MKHEIRIPDDRKMQGLWIPVGVYRLPMSWAKKILCLDIKSMKSYYKSNTMIGEFLGCSDRQARRLVSELLAEGWIEARHESAGSENEVRFLVVSEKFNAAYHDERPEMAAPPAENGHPPRPEMAAPPAENGHPVLPVSLNRKIKHKDARANSQPIPESNPETERLLREWSNGYFSLTGRSRSATLNDAEYLETVMQEYQLTHDDIRAYMHRLFAEWKAAARDEKRFWPLRITALDGKLFARLDTELAADEEETAELMRMGGYDYIPAHLRSKAG